MSRISIISAVFVVSLALPALIATAKEEAPAIPRLRVTVLPHHGIIPASMVNGRPVYKFEVAVVDERRRMMFAVADTLLQAGDTKSVERGSEKSGLVRGAIAIDGQGRASYKAQYLKDGRPLLETSAKLRLLPE